MEARGSRLESQELIYNAQSPFGLCAVGYNSGHQPAERVTERWLNSLRLFCHPLHGFHSARVMWSRGSTRGASAPRVEPPIVPSPVITGYCIFPAPKGGKLALRPLVQM